MIIKPTGAGELFAIKGRKYIYRSIEENKTVWKTFVKNRLGLFKPFKTVSIEDGIIPKSEWCYFKGFQKGAVSRRIDILNHTTGVNNQIIRTQGLPRTNFISCYDHHAGQNSGVFLDASSPITTFDTADYHLYKVTAKSGEKRLIGLFNDSIYDRKIDK